MKAIPAWERPHPRISVQLCSDAVREYRRGGACERDRIAARRLGGERSNGRGRRWEATVPATLGRVGHILARPDMEAGIGTTETMLRTVVGFVGRAV